jgi:hypothetical protein
MVPSNRRAIRGGAKIGAANGGFNASISCSEAY